MGENILIPNPTSGSDPSLFLVAWIPSPRGGGGCLPAFLEILGALSGITPRWGEAKSGLVFLGENICKQNFHLPLSSGLPDLVSTLAVLCYICGPQVVGSNSGR